MCKKGFLAAVKDVNLQKLKNLPLQILLFSFSKFVFRRKRYDVKIWEDFTQEYSRKSQVKP